jgi:hypothetical protein
MFVRVIFTCSGTKASVIVSYYEAGNQEVQRRLSSNIQRTLFSVAAQIVSHGYDFVRFATRAWSLFQFLQLTKFIPSGKALGRNSGDA